MGMGEIRFHKPETVDSAANIAQHAVFPVFIVGGQRLVPALSRNEVQATDIIDISAMPEMKGIRRKNKSIRIGAAETHSAIAFHADVESAIPSLGQLVGAIGDLQVRNRGTLGGALVGDRTSSDYSAAGLALAAEIETNKRRICAEKFFSDDAPINRDEIIVAASFHIPTRAHYEKLAHPAAGYAEVGVFVAVNENDIASVALIGEGIAPQYVPAAQLIMDTALKARSSPTPDDALSAFEDSSLSDYQCAVAATLFARAVRQCLT